MLRPAELDAVRQAALAAMPDSGVVQRYHQPTDTWVTVGTYPCRVMPKRAVTRDAGGNLQGVTLWNLLMPHDADAQVGDRVAVGARTYSVTGSDAGRSEAIALVVQCSRIG